MKNLDLAISILLGLGTFFCAVATIGILRLPDVFLRIHAATKASTFGILFLATATALRFGSGEASVAVNTKCALLVVFLFLTAPVSAHLIGRAARKRQNPQSERTTIDEYDL